MGFGVNERARSMTGHKPQRLGKYGVASESRRVGRSWLVVIDAASVIENAEFFPDPQAAAAGRCGVSRDRRA